MLILKKADYEKIVDHALAGLPNESCGLIAGSVSGDIKTVKKVYTLVNTDASREHFSIDPREQLTAVKDMRANGFIPLGNFHSHPETPARPSEEDKRLAYDATASYLILSLMDEDAPVLKAFHIEKGLVFEEEIKIV